MHLKHRHHIQSSASKQEHTHTHTHNTMTSSAPPSTKLYDAACVAAAKANQTRFNAARLSVPDELRWYNNHTNWESLDRKGFREVMVRMESITVQHYEDFGTGRSNRSAAIKAFWAEEEAYAEAYAQARRQEEQKEQKEAQAYLDSLVYTSDKEEEPAVHRITCQPVLYIEELTDVQGDPDWRAYIYYDERIRRYVLKGTRRSLRATSRKTVYPEVKLCFRSSRELASFLCSSTETLNVSMFAMTSATVKDATFAELYALPARGCKTELFGYDETCPRYSTFVNYLRIVRDMDASHSTFAAF